jgi:hypothetical protein
MAGVVIGSAVLTGGRRGDVVDDRRAVVADRVLDRDRAAGVGALGVVGSEARPRGLLDHCSGDRLSGLGHCRSGRLDPGVLG